MCTLPYRIISDFVGLHALWARVIDRAVSWQAPGSDAAVAIFGGTGTLTRQWLL